MMAEDKVKIKRALLSVSDKTGLIDFAKQLVGHGVELISTGGTAKAIKDAGLAVKDISEVTGFPEMLDGRVKTLHPVVHGGLLSLRDNKEHMETIARHNIKPIDLVCVNLYPFEATISKPNVELHEAIENIDIGGPSMIRSASKNYRSVTVVTSASQYPAVIKELTENSGATTFKLRQELAIEAFGNTARYDGTIHEYLHRRLSEKKWPDIFTISGLKVQEMRYGENPHQPAAFYKDRNNTLPTVANGKQLQGKELSYNNIMDADAALALVKEFDDPAATVIKHTNPCGTAIGKDVAEAFAKAFASDPLSAFGGIVAVNRLVTENTAKMILEKLSFFEIMLAPSYEEGALKAFEARKNLRVMSVEGLGKSKETIPGYHVRRVEGGFLVQDFDQAVEDKSQFKIVSQVHPDPKLAKDMDFGWKLVKHVKSNGIVLVKNGVSIGVGAGQMNRVGSLEIAIKQAGDMARGSVMASDALLPFRDSVDACAKAGVAAIIQTGGSVRDAEVIEAANQHGIPMIFTSYRHFKH
jgi:phosphoribosylaminoimidazolecarboxamide formyltransferase/IMP cyclohydrolase